MKRKQKEEELSLESWKMECAEMEAESDREDAELRKQMEEIEANAEMDPEVKQAMLEVGKKVLGMGEWFKDFNARTTDMIAHCDEIIAKCEATDRKPRGRQGKGRRK